MPFNGFIENELIKKTLRGIKKDIVNIFSSYDSIDETVTGMLKPDIDGMERRLQNYLVQQKTENFRLIKELAILEKEKEDLQKEIVAAIKRLDKLENAVGFKNNNKTEDKKTINSNSDEATQKIIAQSNDQDKI